jgi:hypothetical protein
VDPGDFESGPRIVERGWRWIPEEQSDNKDGSNTRCMGVEKAAEEWARVGAELLGDRAV